MFNRAFKQTWFRLFIKLFITFLLIITVVTSIFIFHYMNDQIIEVKNTAQKNVNRLSERLTYIMEDFVSLAFCMYNDDAVFTWIHDASIDNYKNNAMVMTVARYLYTKFYVKSVTLINTRSNKVYSTVYGSSEIHSFMEPEMIDTVYENEENAHYLFMQYVSQGQDYLLLRLPNSHVRQQFYGYLVILIDSNELISILAADKVSDDTSFFVLDKNDMLVLGNPELFNQSSLDTSLPKLNLLNIWSFMSKGSLISSNPVERFSWTIYYTIPISETLLNGTFLQVVLLVNMLMATALLIFSFVFSRAELAPFDSLAKNVMNEIGNNLIISNDRKKDTHGFDILQNSIRFLQESLASSNRTLYDQKKLVQKNELVNWLLFPQGEVFKTHEDNLDRSSMDQSQVHTVRSASSHIILVAIRVEGYFNEDADYTYRYHIKKELETRTTEFLKTIGLKADYVEIGDDCSALILYGDHSGADEINDFLFQIKKDIQEHLFVTLAISMSSSLPADCTYVSTVFNMLYNTSFLSYLWGSDRIYSETDYHEYKTMVTPLSNNDTFERLINQISVSNGDEWRETVDNIFNSFSRLSYEEARFNVIMITYMLAVRSFSRFFKTDDFAVFKKMITQAPDLKHIKMRFERICEIIQYSIHALDATTQKHGHISIGIMKEISNQISNPSLSPDTIAAHTGLSTNYVRKLLKSI